MNDESSEQRSDGEHQHSDSVAAETNAAHREDDQLELEHRRQMEARRLEHELEMETETLHTQRDLRRRELELNHHQRTLERQLDLKEQERLLERRLQAELASRQRDLAANYMSTIKAEIIEQQFAKVSDKARGREVRSFILLGILLAVAGASVYAGRLVDAPMFWAVSATIFFMSCVGITIFAAAGLGAAAQMVELIRMQFRSRDATIQSSLMQVRSDADGDLVTLRALFDGAPDGPSGEGDDSSDDAQPALIEPIGKHTENNNEDRR
jgi:hypothetical protein